MQCHNLWQICFPLPAAFSSLIRNKQSPAYKPVCRTHVQLYARNLDFFFSRHDTEGHFREAPCRARKAEFPPTSHVKPTAHLYRQRYLIGSWTRVAIIERTISCSPGSLHRWWQPNPLLCNTHLRPPLLFMDAELLGSTAIVKILSSQGASSVPKPQRRLQLWVDSPARSLFNNIRGGICSLSDANLSCTSPISVTRKMLERSQGTKGKKCGFLPRQLIPCFKGQQMMKGKSRQSRCPALKTLDPSLNESGWAFCLEMEFLPFSSSFLPSFLSAVGWFALN